MGNYRLSNPASNDKTRRIYEYICGNFGKRIITAQQESIWVKGSEYEMDHLKAVTGRLPAMRGLDFKDNDFEGVVERSKEWSSRGGLVNICWHTGVGISGYPESKEEFPDFERLFTEGTEENRTLMATWERGARCLQELRDADVTVLWRPFHEFDGKWFWWGKGGAENFKRLWRMMYEKYTREYGLNNLIWVLGYADNVEDGWYPGDEYCDIVGSDHYEENGASTHKLGWERSRALADKPAAFHECGPLPEISDFVRDGAMWSWFMIWHSKFLMENDEGVLSRVYNDDLAVTLDKLPENLSCN
ncbi:MAG: glycoside hydrolase family 26 protein [Oscillospiraceae bacterium]|nr:glycoside hydrolase family 26 protein [Oscillospiraceae bacterium]